MDLFVILRRDGWQSGDELELAAQRSTEEGERRGDVRWIRSYVLEEEGGSLGTVCIYEAESEQAIREHAAMRAPGERDHQGRRHRDRAARPREPARAG